MTDPRSSAPLEASLWGRVAFDQEPPTPELTRAHDAVLWPRTWTLSGWTIAIDGYFVWQDRLWLGRTAQDCEAVTAAMTRDLAGWLRALQNGAFTIVIHDARERRTLLITDRFGLIPMYVMQSPNGLVFGSDLETIRAQSREPIALDPVGLSELYWFGYQIGNRTALRGVHYLPPGSIASVSWATRASSATSWVDDLGRDREPRPLKQLAGQAADIAGRACSRLHVPGQRYALKLSGGMDSRLIALSWQPRPLNAYTWGDPDSFEVSLAARLSTALGLAHRYVPLEPTPFHDTYRDMHRRFGLMEFLHEQASPLILADDCSLVLDGLGGDFLLGGLFQKRTESPSDWLRAAVGMAPSREPILAGDEELAERLFRRLAVEDKSFPVLTPETKSRIDQDRAEVLADLTDEIKKYRRPSDDWVDLTARVIVANRTRRYIALQAAPGRPRLQTCFPYMDIDLLRFAMGLPGHLTANKRLYLEIFRHTPQCRTIPTIMSLLPFTWPAPLHYLGRVSRSLRERAIGEAARLTRGRWLGRPMEATQWTRWVATQATFREDLVALLVSSRVVDAGALESVVSEVARFRRRVSGTRLLLTASYSAWHPRGSA